MKMSKLSPKDYLEACKLTQIVSIDLIVSDGKGKYLVGLRNNPPAKGTYFVPGGRVYKRESIEKAKSRIMMDELGDVMSDVKFHGVYEHYYPNENPSGVDGVDTHYVVLAYMGKTPLQFDILQFMDQHKDLLWLTKEEILQDKRVHPLTKAYFDDVFRPVF